MARPPKKGRKVRVEFRQNRVVRGRGDDWTRKYRADEDRALDARGHESVRAKGELSRKRTIVVSDDDAPIADASQWRAGVAIAVHGLVCRICDDQGRMWDCTVRRILRTLLIEQRSPVTVGDRVWFSAASEPGALDAVLPEAVGAWRRQLAQTNPGTELQSAGVGVIERVEERRTRLSRKERRGREHTIVANADQLLIVASITQPRLKPHLIDRYIVAAHKGGMRPLIALNKADLIPMDWEAEVAAADAALTISAARGAADALEDAAFESDTGPDEPTSAVEIDEQDDFGDFQDEGTDGVEDDDSGEDDAAATESDEELDAAFADLDDEGEGIPRQTVAEVVAEYRRLGYRVIFTSAASGQGIEELRQEMAGRTTVLSGQSGVGKSSLINAIHPGLRLSIGDVSDDTDKGKHTTSHAQLIPLTFGGFVVDTPGVRAFDLWGLERADFEAYFAEIAPLVANCQYSNCSHVDQEGCAVVAAVEADQISLRRYASYVKMYAEAARLPRW